MHGQNHIKIESLLSVDALQAGGRCCGQVPMKVKFYLFTPWRRVGEWRYNST